MREISGHTGLTGLLGSPVSHSISPAMHNTAFQMLGLDYVYLAFDVGTDRLKEAVEGLKALKVRGFNVTMPDKNLMARLCDELSPAAQISGSVNTVLNENGRLTGYTTDGAGYMRSLRERGFDIIGEKMTLLGAGGAATSILVQAALDGVREISVFSRHSQFWDRMESMIEQVNQRTSCRARLFDYEDMGVLKREIGGSRILVNATSVGMAPREEGCIIPEEGWLFKDLIVSDVIYNPRKTRLLAMAEEAGCPWINGMDMLLYQGAEAFRIWTGQDMPVDVIKEKYFS